MNVSLDIKGSRQRVRGRSESRPSGPHKVKGWGQEKEEPGAWNIALEVAGRYVLGEESSYSSDPVAQRGLSPRDNAIVLRSSVTSSSKIRLILVIKRSHVASRQNSLEESAYLGEWPLRALRRSPFVTAASPAHSRSRLAGPCRAPDRDRYPQESCGVRNG